MAAYSGDQVKVRIMGFEDTALPGQPTSTGQKTAANSTSVVPASDAVFTVALEGDCIAGENNSVDVTLGATDAVWVGNIPAGSKGFQVLSPSARLRFRLNTDPPSSYAATSSTPYTFGAGNLYNSVAAGKDIVRKFQPGVALPTDIRFNSETASATFTLEFF